MDDALQVYLKGTAIGQITPDPANRRRVRFEVAASYDGAANMLSEGFSLLPGGKVDNALVSRFLGGYLPEGKNRTALASRIPGLNETDLYSMLRHYGVTTAGALSVRASRPDEDLTPAYRALDKRAFTSKLAKAVQDHDLGNEPGSGRSALPGFQPKVLLARFDGQWFQPLRSAHSTHIVKPAPVHRPALIADEFYSHELTRSMNLSQFTSELVEVNGVQHLAIERYDRIIHGYGEVEAIHQEDAAQAIGLDWVDANAKFQDDQLAGRRDRPSARRIAEIFGSSERPETVERWLSYLMFTVLVGNHDGHAKNVSIMHGAHGTDIADLYDAVPILHINDDPARAKSGRVKDTLSLAVGGEFSHHAVTLEHFLAEVDSWGVISARRTALVIANTLERFAVALVTTTVPPGATSNLRDRLGYNFDRLSNGKSIGKPKLPIQAWLAR
jgi:serine/threonine-protein kinase HipA